MVTSRTRHTLNTWLLAGVVAWLSLPGVLAADRKRAKSDNAPAPVFSIPGGVFTNELTVELKADGAVVRFTTDGSEPTTDSTLYGEPLRITNCALVRARAWSSNGLPGSVASQSYLILAPDVVTFESNLPLILIHSAQGEIENRDKLLNAMRIVASVTGTNTPRSAEDFDGLALLNVRGYSSLRYPKHSFSVKVVSELREPRKVPLLGLPKEADWVLYGPYPDKTLMRDALAYELSNAMGRWAPRTRFVEVFLNESAGRIGMEDYVGVYLLVEKVTRDKNRVNIKKLEPAHFREPEITGGYIFKKDHVARSARRNFGEDGPPTARTTSQAGLPTAPGGFPADPAGFLPAFESRTRGTLSVNRSTTLRGRRMMEAAEAAARPRTNYVASASPRNITLREETVFPDEEGFRTTLQGNQFYYHDPEADEITGVQRAWLKQYLNAFEAALYGPDFTNATKGYRAFIDPDSFIDHHLFVEVTKNVDGFRFSTYYHKDRSGRLQMGPAWDWNLSFGNADGKQGYMPEYWLWPQLDDQQYSWFRRLFEDPDFAQRYVDRWAQLRTNVFATANILARIDVMAKLLGPAQQRNFAKWEILGREVAPNYFVGDDYPEEVNWMKQWIEKRLAWLEKQFLPAPAVTLGQNAFSLSTSVSGATIYFASNGADPRAPGGGVAREAQAFSAPISPPPSGPVLARVHIGTRWSPPVLVIPGQP